MLSDHQGLVAAIRDNPDDDTPRLACADWFEEQGGDANVARAEFIRTQVECARLEPNDPRQSELEARELRLLKQYAPEWCRAHFLFKKVRFRRGFIEYVHLHLHHFLHHRRQILELEPIRDISLTGWRRAPDDLIRRVAACAEWKLVETLRIHHQGPHRGPRGNAVTLIESPHLTGLKSLRVPSLTMDAEERRRFEQAPVLEQLNELTLSSLARTPNDPNAWLADGGRGAAWENIRALRLTDHSVSPDLITRLSAMPFWNRLKRLLLTLPYRQTNDVLGRLGEVLPPSLEELRLEANHSPVEIPDANSFYSRLSKLPLRVLELKWVPISVAALDGLFADASRCELRSLRLDGCRLTGEHLEALARSERARRLSSLHLGEYPGVPDAAARLLHNLQAVAHLSIDLPAQGSVLMDALAGAGGLTRLRSLVLRVDDPPRPSIEQFLRSANLQQLVRLDLGNVRGPLAIDRALARLLVRLPALAYLKLMVSKIDRDARDILDGSESLAWTSILSEDDPATWERDPKRLPPLDGDLVELDRGS